MTTELTKAAQQALEACPFCGHSDVTVSEIEDRKFVMCQGCGADIDTMNCDVDPVRLWNTRALTQRPAAQTEREAKMTEIDLQDDDALRFAQRVLEGDAPESDRKAARDMLVAIRTRVRKARASLPAPQQATPEPVFVIEVRECPDCGHIGINEWHPTDSACSHCEWTGPSPQEDKCPGCSTVGSMSSACPKCGHKDTLIASKHLPMPAATPEPVGEQATVPRDAYDALERERDYWRTRARAMLDHAEGTCWYWMGDGEDHLESLVNSLPVVIRADQLRELLARPAPAVPEDVHAVCNNGDCAWGGPVSECCMLGDIGPLCPECRETVHLCGKAHPAPDVEAAAKKLAECMDYPWEHMPSAGRDNMRKHAEAVLAAAQAKGGEHE